MYSHWIVQRSLTAWMRAEYASEGGNPCGHADALCRNTFKQMLEVSWKSQIVSEHFECLPNIRSDPKRMEYVKYRTDLWRGLNILAQMRIPGSRFPSTNTIGPLYTRIPCTTALEDRGSQLSFLIHASLAPDLSGIEWWSTLQPLQLVLRQQAAPSY